MRSLQDSNIARSSTQSSMFRALELSSDPYMPFPFPFRNKQLIILVKLFEYLSFHTFSALRKGILAVDGPTCSTALRSWNGLPVYQIMNGNTA
jgi:hypothetical protein